MRNLHKPEFVDQSFYLDWFGLLVVAQSCLHNLDEDLHMLHCVFIRNPDRPLNTVHTLVEQIVVIQNAILEGKQKFDLNLRLRIFLQAQFIEKIVEVAG